MGYSLVEGCRSHASNKKMMPSRSNTYAWYRFFARVTAWPENFLDMPEWLPLSLKKNGLKRPLHLFNLPQMDFPMLQVHLKNIVQAHFASLHMSPLRSHTSGESGRKRA